MAIADTFTGTTTIVGTSIMAASSAAITGTIITACEVITGEVTQPHNAGASSDTGTAGIAAEALVGGCGSADLGIRYHPYNRR